MKKWCLSLILALAVVFVIIPIADVHSYAQAEVEHKFGCSFKYASIFPPDPVKCEACGQTNSFASCEGQVSDMTCEEPAYFQHICTCGEILLSGASPFTPSGHKFSVED